MEISPARSVLNNIVNSELCSSSFVKVDVGKRYCPIIIEVLDPLKTVLEEVVCQLSPEEKIYSCLSELDSTINDTLKLIRSWNLITSKVHMVLQVEASIAKIQNYSLQLYQLVLAVVDPAERNLMATCLEKLEKYQYEELSPYIMEACSNLASEAILKHDILAKISGSLSLSTNPELLMEIVALEKEKGKASNSGDGAELGIINQIVELVKHMHESFVEERQVHSINGVLIPSDFCCPLSLELMSDPVIVASGQTYERVFIKKWLDLGFNVCPKTHQTLGHMNLIPNYTVKALIENWCELNEVKLPDPGSLLKWNFPTSVGHSDADVMDNGNGVLHARSPAGPKSPKSNESTCSTTSTPGRFTTEAGLLDSHLSTQDTQGQGQINLSVSSLESKKALSPSDEKAAASNVQQLTDDSISASNVEQQFHGRISSGSTASAVSSNNNVQGVSDDNTSARVSSDSDVSAEGNRDEPSQSAPRREAEFSPRLGEPRSRGQSIWRRPSDRMVSRIILSPTADAKPDNSGVVAQVRKLVEDLQSDSVNVKRSAATELRFLARHNTENRIIIANCGAIPLLVGLLHSEDTETQSNAVTALLNLSINDNNKIAIANADAIEPLIHVLETGSPEAKENSAATLFSLSVLEDNKAKIGRSRAIGPLVELLGNGTPRGKKDAATALFNLSIFHENKLRIVQAGAVKHLIELMDPATGMVDKAVAVLSNLASIQEGRTTIAQEGGIPLLVEVVELGSSRGKENAAAALFQLCTNSNRFCSLVLQEGAVPPLVALSQSGTPRAKEKAQALLSHFRNQRGMGRP